MRLARDTGSVEVEKAERYEKDRRKARDDLITARRLLARCPGVREIDLVIEENRQASKQEARNSS